MLATGLGAVPFFFFPNLSSHWSERGYAFASGVMLSASVFDRIFPAMKFPPSKNSKREHVNASMLD